ncbi:MAG: glutamate formiminotransferase, partial [Planctomycetota bacterium]|nr:glutamate formiminotransferase [Planctomycetota bacterium]
VGARQFLIAYNVNLESDNLALAKRIARAIRERDGGLPAVKALGLYLEKQRCVQVSMNLVDFTRTGIERVYEEIERLAGESGVKIRESELIGLLPVASYRAGLERRVKLRNFNEDRIVEVRLEKMIKQGMKRWKPL